MKELRRLLGYSLGTAAVIALLVVMSSMENSPSWLLPVAALLFVIVLPVALGIVLARRGKQQRENPSNQP